MGKQKKKKKKKKNKKKKKKKKKKKVMGKVHGGLARAGKVRGQTPKKEKQEKKKRLTGRAAKRVQYNKRFVNVVNVGGRKVGPNSQQLQAILREKMAEKGEVA